MTESKPSFVEYYDESQSLNLELINAGWQGPGWYYWDEGAYLHGPYLSHTEATVALEYYVENL